MAKAAKIKLDTLYKVSCSSEPSPAHYTPVTVEVYSASSNVTIRATTNPDFDGAYDDLPVVTTEAAEGEIYECPFSRSVRFVSFSCSDSDAEIYMAGFVANEIIPEPEPESEPEDENEGE